MGFASAAASPSESANEQLPEKESASKIKTARRRRISTSSPPACVFSCHYLVPVTRVSRAAPAGEQTAHVELFIFYWTALFAETYTLYELDSAHTCALSVSSHKHQASDQDPQKRTQDKLTEQMCENSSDTKAASVTWESGYGGIHKGSTRVTHEKECFI